MPGRGRTTDGFTLIEAMLAVSLTSVAGLAVLMGLASALDASDASIEQLNAAGLAQLYLDELSGKRYCEPGANPRSSSLGPGSVEISGQSRLLFDDMDDFHGVSNQPPRDPAGVVYGQDDGAGGTRHPNFILPSSYFNRYRVECQMYYVSASDLTTRLSSGQSSSYRAVHVRAYVSQPGRGERKLIDLRRVVGYVPSL